MKKYIAFLFALLLCTLLFSGCADTTYARVLNVENTDENDIASGIDDVINELDQIGRAHV